MINTTIIFVTYMLIPIFFWYLIIISYLREMAWRKHNETGSRIGSFGFNEVLTYQATGYIFMPPSPDIIRCLLNGGLTINEIAKKDCVNITISKEL